MNLEHTWEIRKLAVLAAAEAHLAFAAGRASDALRSIAAGLHGGNSILDEPVLVSRLQAMAIHGLLLRVIEDGLAPGPGRAAPLEPEARALVLAELDRYERTPLARCLEGERATAHAMITDPAFPWSELISTIAPLGSPGDAVPSGGSRLAEWASRAAGRAWILFHRFYLARFDAAEYLRRSGELLQVVSGPPETWPRGERGPREGPWYACLTRTLTAYVLPDEQELRDRIARARAALEGAR